MQSEHYLSESEPPFISHQGKARTNVRRSIVICRDQLLTWPLNAVQTNSISIVVGKNYLHLIIGILSLCISAHLTVLLLLNPVLNLTFSLLSITSSHSYASTSDLTCDY